MSTTSYLKQPVLPNDYTYPVSSNACWFTVLQDSQFIMPGFVDTHVHAPQYKFTGTGTDLPVMDWLTHYAFPVEASFQDLTTAKYRYNLLVST